MAKINSKNTTHQHIQASICADVLTADEHAHYCPRPKTNFPDPRHQIKKSPEQWYGSLPSFTDDASVKTVEQELNQPGSNTAVPACMWKKGT